jgi:hypothetical protein
MNVRHDISYDPNTDTYALFTEASFGVVQHFTSKAWQSQGEEKAKQDSTRLLYTSVYNEPLTAVVHLYKRMEVMKESLEVERPDLAEELAVLLQFLREIRALMRAPK